MGISRYNQDMATDEANRIARPQLLNERVIRLFCNVIEEGKSMADAAKVVGVDRVTAFEWRRLGRIQKEGLYHEFYVALQDALDVRDDMLENVIYEQAIKGVQIVERREKDEDTGTITISRAQPRSPADAKWLISRRDASRRHEDLMSNKHTTEQVHELMRDLLGIFHTTFQCSVSRENQDLFNSAAKVVEDRVNAMIARTG